MDIAEFSQVVYRTFVPLITVVLAVIVASRFVKIEARPIARVNVYLFVPSLIFTNLINTQLSVGEISRVFGANITSGLVMAGIASAIAVMLRLPRKTAGTFAAMAVIMNGLNFGLPFIEFSLGPQAIDRAVVYNIGQVFMVYSLGIFLISNGTLSLREAFSNVFKVPMPYAFVLAIVLNTFNVPVPDPMIQGLNKLGLAVVPAALVILGLQLKGARLEGKWPTILAIAGTRFGFGILIAFGVTWLFGLEGLTRQTFILLYSMPVGVASSVLATEFNGDTDLTAAGIAFTTLISIIPLSFLLYFLS